ncbi:D-sedoheptulose-7-phosphate isomerase [Catenulispora rubra]|uniref:D-sedoheptulose-7-phosphate isomerase n=1 Tax=Catenulispora rubra TaxID=280293 RepID=UPI001E30648E|nr:SIS domain-containing protein [Catenulispora rubra]
MVTDSPNKTDKTDKFIAEAFARRVEPIARLSDSADAVAEACLAMARAFRSGGRLLVFGTGTAATDAQHVSVEFVHPVIVGKRALPAFSLAADAATVTGLAGSAGLEAVFAHQLRVLGRPADIALGISGDGECPAVARALVTARELGMTTVALVGGTSGTSKSRGSAEDSRTNNSGREIAKRALADHCLTVESDDPRVVKEGHVTLYHLLWELTHAFLEQPHAADPAQSPEPAGAGITGLYPFLYSGEASVTELTAEVAASARSKIAEIVDLRREIGVAEAQNLAACAQVLARGFADGATLLAFGNGGSSSDAQDVVHTFLDPGPGATARPALCLTNDTAVLTALSNDIGFDVVFARQLQAVGRPGDIAVAVSTSGGSANVLAALAAARKSGMTTVGFAGYDGGRMAEPGLVDHLFAVPSASVHRIQEIQTTLYHVLWELVQAELARA